ncbi:integrin alpha-4 [Mobula hypostoma]|uniref:integrin alpha-4 n=1 Tax=Mobula hypostoma TaxID=723540 RepID=UPI002FC2D548
MRLEKFPVGWRDIWVTVVLYCLFRTVHLYNLDLKNPVQFKGTGGTYFGYSVILHSGKDKKWVVVGAPKANSSVDKVTVNPGAIYKCAISQDPDECEEIVFDNLGSKCGLDCEEEKDNQWLGVSLTRQPTKDGYILACAHRWKNIFYIKEDKRPLGLCFKIGNDLQPSQDSPLIPCFKESQRMMSYEALCQAGISSLVTEDLIVMGAPGFNHWTGTVIVKSKMMDSFLFFKESDAEVTEGGYLGYAVTAGHFIDSNSTEIVGGAPQQGMIGHVYIFKQNGMTLDIIFKAKGKKIGTYFGSSLCALDLNSDGLSDLLVGAPLYSVVREEGRVYVYLNEGSGKMKELDTELVGGNSYAARFGEAIVDLGDMDNDGYSDIAIGAPQEDNQRGAIYIYNGRETGISLTFSQKILGRQISNELRAFGCSISGGIDVDDNGYPDVAVGAFMSNTVLLLRSRPVVNVEAFLQLPPSVNQTQMKCLEGGKPVVCINVTVCFRNKDEKIRGYTVLLYNIHADVHRMIGFPSRFNFLPDDSSGEIMLYHTTTNCKTHQAFMRENIRDVITPVYFEVMYSLGNHIVTNETTDAFPPLQPVMQKNKNETSGAKKKIYFERLCAFKDCAADLQVSGKLIMEGHHANKSYLAVKEVKRIILNIDLFNAGDDAYSSTLNVKMPKGISFVKTVEMVEKYVICHVTEEENSTLLECSVGNLYMDSQSKMELHFFLDTSKLTAKGEDLIITINTTCENEHSLDLLHDNFVPLTLPLKYEVDVAVEGSVFPSSFLYEGTIGDDLGTFNFFDSPCAYKDITYSFHVVNSGNNMAPDIELNIAQPNTLEGNDFELFEILHIKVLDHSHGKCYFEEHLKNCTNLPDVSVLHQMFNFVNKYGTKELSCSSHGISCVNIRCQLGDIESRERASIHISMRLRYVLLASDTAASTLFFTTAVASSGSNLDIIHKGEIKSTVTMEAYYNFKPKIKVLLGIIISGFLLLVISFLHIIGLLWKCGFFKRILNDRIEDVKRNQQENCKLIDLSDDHQIEDDFQRDQE